MNHANLTKLASLALASCWLSMMLSQLSVVPLKSGVGVISSQLIHGLVASLEVRSCVAMATFSKGRPRQRRGRRGRREEVRRGSLDFFFFLFFPRHQFYRGGLGSLSSTSIAVVSTYISGSEDRVMRAGTTL